MDAVWPGGIRVTPKEEEIGLDLSQNGERAVSYTHLTLPTILLV